MRLLYSARSVALVVSLLVCGTTTLMLTLVRSMPPQGLALAAAVSFSSTFLLVYTTFEFLVFREVTKVFRLLERINKKEVKQMRRVMASNPSPIQKIKEEIFNMATRNQQEIEELRKLEIYRREFIADISHELKTPLFAAQGFIHTLIDGAIDDVTIRDRFLRKAATSLDGLGEMVGDLLLLSQLETGILQMRSEIFELGHLGAEVVDQLVEKAESRAIHIKLEKPPGKPLWVEADRQRIRQVLANLIENAIKYGSEGGHVNLIFEHERETVAIFVRDNGPGIPPEHIGRIFDRFYRIEKSRSRDMGGIGLGLSIVKQILDAHNAKISVSSKLGKGTEFSFKLKRKKIARPRSELVPQPANNIHPAHDTLQLPTNTLPGSSDTYQDL
jgi:two-component system, OmpR family, phosphate regulon sensor histidine kinase PhoR